MSERVNDFEDNDMNIFRTAYVKNILKGNYV